MTLKFLRGCLFLCLFLLCFFGFAFTADAEGVGAAISDDEWEGFYDSLPPEAFEYFSDGAFENVEKYSEALDEKITPKNIVVALLDMIGVEAKSSFKILFVLVGVILVSAALSAISKLAESSALRSMLRFCSLGAVFASVIYVFYEHFDRVEMFFERISVFFNGMIPITASVWALGGNITTATAGSATLYCFLTVFEGLWASSAVPICAFLVTLGFCDVLCSELKTGRIVSTVKKIYGFFLGLSMTVLLSSLAAQTVICAASDSVAARTGRLVSNTLIPMVGGNLGEALRTVASSVTYLKSIFGIGGIIIIALLVLPTVFTLILARFAFGIASALADIVGCEEESKLLSCFSEAYGCMLAVVVGVGMMFVLALCIFMKTVVAVA